MGLHSWMHHVVKQAILLPGFVILFLIVKVVDIDFDMYRSGTAAPGRADPSPGDKGPGTLCFLKASGRV
jgi:hypothetical protein